MMLDMEPGDSVFSWKGVSQEVLGPAGAQSVRRLVASQKHTDLWDRGLSRKHICGFSRWKPKEATGSQIMDDHKILGFLFVCLFGFFTQRTERF